MLRSWQWWIARREADRLVYGQGPLGLGALMEVAAFDEVQGRVGEAPFAPVVADPDDPNVVVDLGQGLRLALEANQSSLARGAWEHHLEGDLDPALTITG